MVLIVKRILFGVVKEKFGIVNKVKDIEEERNIDEVIVIEGG